MLSFGATLAQRSYRPRFGTAAVVLPKAVAEPYLDDKTSHDLLYLRTGQTCWPAIEKADEVLVFTNQPRQYKEHFQAYLVDALHSVGIQDRDIQEADVTIYTTKQRQYLKRLRTRLLNLGKQCFTRQYSGRVTLAFQR